jgi:hypothetical protein
MYISYVIRVNDISKNQIPLSEIVATLRDAYLPDKLIIGYHICAPKPHFHVHMHSELDQNLPKFKQNRSRIVEKLRCDDKYSISSRIYDDSDVIDPYQFFGYALKEYYYHDSYMYTYEEESLNIYNIPSIGFPQSVIEDLAKSATYTFKVAKRALDIKQERINAYSKITADLYEFLDDNRSEWFVEPIGKHNLDGVAPWRKMYHNLGTIICSWYLEKNEVPPDKTSETVLHYMILNKLLKAQNIWDIKNKYKVYI